MHCEKKYWLFPVKYDIMFCVYVLFYYFSSYWFSNFKFENLICFFKRGKERKYKVGHIGKVQSARKISLYDQIQYIKFLINVLASAAHIQKFLIKKKILKVGMTFYIHRTRLTQDAQVLSWMPKTSNENYTLKQP